jgi:hypothetical protein
MEAAQRRSEDLKRPNTPTMRASIVDRPLTFREIFSRVLPPRKHTTQDLRNGSDRSEVRWS